MTIRVYTEARCSEERLKSTVARLAQPEFQPFIRFLEDRLFRARETLQNATEPATLYRAQGHANELEDILETIEVTAGHLAL